MEAIPSVTMPSGVETTVEEEHRLVEEVLHKDRKATARFVGLCADWVYAFVRHRVQPRDELVDDLMQEIVIAAWQGLADFRGDAGLRSWVLGIARHKVEDYYRKRIRETSRNDEEEFSEPATVPDFEEQLDSVAQQERVHKTLALLPESYALALLWRYREEKSAREMAELTGKTEKAIERLLARARENFRKRWSDGKP
jgi:RNA polymerase sigma-70 factor, ECF subfamily